jgi:hypothetical protein
MDNPRVRLGTGWDNDRALQLDRLVDGPQGREYERLKALLYFGFHAELLARILALNDNYRFRICWARLSNYKLPRKVEEYNLSLDEIAPSFEARLAGAAARTSYA